MGSAPCAWAQPVGGLGHPLNVSATIEDLRENGFNCYVQVIEDAPPYTFDDLKHLLPSAQAAGVSVWPVLIPPSEGARSLPYKSDYVRWMQALARLSLKYPALRGVNIDDYLVRISSGTFTRSYTCQLYQTMRQINPKLLFMPTIYDLDPDAANRLAGCVDGVWLWWTNLEENSGMRSYLEDSRVIVAGRFPVYSGVYASKTSWHKGAAPSPRILKGALETACAYSNGALIYQLPLGPKASDNPLLAVARGFAGFAGKCGMPDR